MIKRKGKNNIGAKLSSEKKATRKVKPPSYNESPPSGQDHYAVEMPGLANDDFSTYLSLRQSIDSLAYVAIFYYASAENSEQKTERQKYLRDNLKQLGDQILKRSGYPGRGIRTEPAGPSDAPCPPGMKRCPSGECVATCLPCVV